MYGLFGHGAPVIRFRRRVLPPSEARLRGLVPVAASPVPTISEPLLAISSRQPPCRPLVDGKPGEQGLRAWSRGGRRVQAPGHHPDVVPAARGRAALAGVEATVRCVNSGSTARTSARSRRCAHTVDAGKLDAAQLSRAPQQQALESRSVISSRPLGSGLTSHGRLSPRDHPGHPEGGTDVALARAAERSPGRAVSARLARWTGWQGTVRAVVSADQATHRRERAVACVRLAPPSTAAGGRLGSGHEPERARSDRSGNSAGTERSGNRLLTISPSTLR